MICDGGFRRGTDIFKAMALGVIDRHRAPLHLGTRGVRAGGVETVLALLRREFELVMKQMGTLSVPAITRAYVVEAP